MSRKLVGHFFRRRLRRAERKFCFDNQFRSNGRGEKFFFQQRIGNRRDQKRGNRREHNRLTIAQNGFQRIFKAI